MWADGSRSFTAVPVGPSVDPSVPNHLARKAYVDAESASAANAAALVLNQQAYFPASLGAAFGNKMSAESIVVTTTSGGNFSYAFPHAFTSICYMVICCCGSSSETSIWNPQPNAWTPSGFSGRIGTTNVDGGEPSGNLYRINYIAVGI